MITDKIPSLKEKVLTIDKPGEIENVLEYKTPYERFKETAIEMGESTAILYMGNKVSYKEMLENIDIAAKGFSKLGVKNNDVVAMSALATPFGIIAFYALDKIGATMHMVNCTSGKDEIVRELSNFKSELFVANDLFCTPEMRIGLEKLGIKNIVAISLLDFMPKGINGDKIKYSIAEKAKGLKKNDFDGNKIYSVNQLLALGRSCKDDIDAVEYDENHMTAVAYTSGSTGDAKACVSTPKNIDALVQVMAMTELGRFNKGEIMLSTFPLWIYYSLLNMIHEPLVLGITLALDPLFKPENIFKRNKQYGFNHWLTIPPYVKKTIELDKSLDCSKWKIFLTGGDALPDELKIAADEFIKKNGGTAKLVQGYGASECLGSFSYCYYPDSTLGSVGKPCVGNMIKVLDVDTGEELGPNQMGVGYFYTPARMKEYYGDPEATAYNLVKDGNGVIWYNTEDLIHYNEQGEIFLDGRIRRIVITMSEDGTYTKLIPDRIKKELLHHKQVEKCEVITIPDEERTNMAIAFVVSNADKDDLIAHCKENLPEYMVPKNIVFIDEIPLTSAKKPDLKRLEDMYEKNDYES